MAMRSQCLATVYEVLLWFNGLLQFPKKNSKASQKYYTEPRKEKKTLETITF